MNNQIQISDNEELKKLKGIYGDNVLCTNGLFHAMCRDHSEVYINKNNNKIDNRVKYITIVVMQSIIVSRVCAAPKDYVILRKNDLNWIYRTSNKIVYVDENILYESTNSSTNLISHLGKVLCSVDDMIGIMPLGNDRYVIKSKKSYADRVVFYDRKLGELLDLSNCRSYMIEKSRTNDRVIVVTFINGITYEYNLDTKICINRFTGKEEFGIILW